MDLKQIRSFRAVFEFGSLSKASDRLHIAQPALSRQIQLLEHDLKTPLFIRTGRGMTPTDAGRLLFERTTGLTRQLEQVREDVLSASGEPTGRVIVGMVPTVSSALAFEVTKAVFENYPNISLRMVDAYGSYLVDWLHRGEVDLAIIYGPASGLHLKIETLFEDNLQIVSARGKGLSEKSEVDLQWVARLPLVLPSHPHALRVLIDEMFSARELDANVRVEADSFQALINIVKGGIGYTFLPFYSIASQIKSGALEAAPLAPPLRREIALALPPQRKTSVAAECVAQIVRKETFNLYAERLKIGAEKAKK